MKNKRYNNIEEWANTLSHGIGILLGIVAGYLLLEKASENIEPQWAVACVSVYLAGMLSSYVSSTWYHGSRPGKLKELLRKFDHGAIYLHIAGTYTPFTLLVLRHAGGWGWGIFAFVWLSAIAGFILSFKKLKEHSNLETASIYPRQPIFVNLKSNTMKNTVQRYGLFGYLQIFRAKQPNL